MLRSLPRNTWASVVFACAVLYAQPVWAQFDEPDTIPKWAVGPYIEAAFRGALGELVDGPTLDLSNGPAFGARVEYRVGAATALGLSGSYARSSEKFETASGDATTGGDLTIVNLVGEVLWRIKPSVPGYFVFGAGVRYSAPKEDDPLFGNADSYTEPLGVIGLGIEPLRRRKGLLRLYLRLYIVATAEQPIASTSSLRTDVALGLAYLFRL